MSALEGQIGEWSTEAPTRQVVFEGIADLWLCLHNLTLCGEQGDLRYLLALHPELHDLVGTLRERWNAIESRLHDVAGAIESAWEVDTKRLTMAWRAAARAIHHYLVAEQEVYRRTLRKGAVQTQHKVAHPSMRVLLAMHLPVLQELVRADLQDEGYEILCARDGDEAARMLDGVVNHPSEQSRLDALVISDELPGSSGIDILEGLNHFDWSVPTVILQSNMTLNLANPVTADTRISYVLMPPFCSEAIRHAVNDVLAANDNVALLPADAEALLPVEHTEHPKKILIVDDEQDVSASLQYIFQTEGFRCTCAATGTDALIAASRDVPDLVLLDLNLPGFDGTEVCLRIKADPAFSRTSVVMLTARDSPEDLFLGRQVGADKYIAKPFDMNDVIEQVRAILHT